MLRRIAVLAALGLLCSGCLPFLHPGSVDRSVDGSYDQVFQATLEVLERLAFPIRRVDRSEGRIVTGRRPVWVIEQYRRVEKAEARIRDDGTHVQVSLLLSFVDQVSGRPPRVEEDGDDRRADDVANAVLARSLSASAIYDEYLDAIEDRVAELKTRPMARSDEE